MVRGVLDNQMGALWVAGLVALVYFRLSVHFYHMEGKLHGGRLGRIGSGSTTIHA